jgi:hypothetical protein
VFVLAAGQFPGHNSLSISNEFKDVLFGCFWFGVGLRPVLGYREVSCSLYVGRILEPGDALEELVLLLERQYFEEAAEEQIF